MMILMIRLTSIFLMGRKHQRKTTRHRSMVSLLPDCSRSGREDIMEYDTVKCSAFSSGATTALHDIAQESPRQISVAAISYDFTKPCWGHMCLKPCTPVTCPSDSWSAWPVGRFWSIVKTQQTFFIWLVVWLPFFVFPLILGF